MIARPDPTMHVMRLNYEPQNSRVERKIEMKNLFLICIGIFILSGCATLIELPISDDDKRIELQKSAENEMPGIHLINKIDADKVCNKNEPWVNRYLCWRYYEIGGDVWVYAWFGQSSAHVGNTILIKNNTPIATGGSGFRWYSDQNKKDSLGYKVIKGAMMPQKRKKLIQPNKKRNELLYESLKNL